jgi:hypothetical protein
MQLYRINRISDISDESAGAAAHCQPPSHKEQKAICESGETSVGEPLKDTAAELAPISDEAIGSCSRESMPGAVESLPSLRSEFESLMKARETLYAKEIADRDQKVADLERAHRSTLRDRELATALVGKPLCQGAAAQLVKLWRDDFEVHELGGVYSVTARDGHDVGQAVNAWLARPEYAHFCLPASRGGTANKGFGRSVATDTTRPVPRNLGEAVVMRWLEASTCRNTETSTPIGLGRRR